MPNKPRLNHKDTKALRKKQLAFGLCVFVFSGISAHAQSQYSANPHQWASVTLFHGLPSDHVRAIAQDQYGTMWFGTDSGLAKYDGRRVQKLATEGPAASRIRALKIDSEGLLWIGSDSGAARLIRGEIKAIPETQSSVITAIITPQAGRALMISQQGEIFDCLSGADGTLSIHTIKPSDHPLLSIDSRARAPLQLTSLALIDDRLIIGTHSRGLIEIDQTQLKSDAAPSDLIKEVLSRPRAFFVEAIATDQGGRVWFGAQTSNEDSGLYFAGDLIHPEKIGSGLGKVTALGFDANNNLWAGTEARGVFVVRERQNLEHFTFENTAAGLRSNQIHSIFIDREGVVWFGTDRGVCRYDPGGVRVEVVSSEPESNVARVLFQSADGILWCGTNRGLFTHSDAGWREVDEFKGRVIHSIGEDQSGRLLIGTASGLFARERAPGSRSKAHMPAFRRLEPSTAQAASRDNIRAISSFQGATYLANFDCGVERLDGASRTLVWPGDSDDDRARQVVSLHAAKDRLWIGTAEGKVFSFDGKRFIAEHALDELIGKSVWSIAESSDDVLWLATAGGLFSFKSGKLQPVIDGIDARCVVSEKNGQEEAIWCATVGGGVVKLLAGGAADPAAPPVASRVDTEQGLPSQNTFAVLSIDGSSRDSGLWIGTSRGVARYEPGVVAPILNVTRVIGKRIFSVEELAAGLSLEYPQNSLAIDVAANSSRTFAEQFQYSFSVVDRDGRLVKEKLSHESQLLLDNLKPGAYRVEARAYSRDLVASAPISFAFNVARAPFPWTSTSLSILLLLALVAMWWGYRQNQRLARTNVALLETRMQLATETETERRRIARDLHDQTLSDLRRLMLLTDQLPRLEEGNGHVQPSKIRAEIESVSTEIRRICEDLSPSALANVGLSAALEWALADELAHQPPEKNVEYEFLSAPALDEQIKLTPAEQIQIYRIAQEALSNACRHSHATRVTLSITIDNRNLMLKIEDNGCGFKIGTSGRTGHGLSNIRSRASLIEADVDWSARPDVGTVFTLRKVVGSDVKNPAPEA